MLRTASDLADRLAGNAEWVCRTYLSNGRRQGRYWLAGDVMNSKGRSLYVCLTGPRAGRWTDAATDEHGDLLDLLAKTCGLTRFRDVVDEARRFLSLPEPEQLEPRSPGNAARLTAWLRDQLVPEDALRFLPPR